MSLSLLDRRRRFWDKVESTIHLIIETAVGDFIKRSNLPTAEDDLNREFYFCLVEANYNLQKSGSGGLSSPPSYESRNQPSADHSGRVDREMKRPDFQWGIIDIEEDPLKSAKHFVLECKRLDQASAQWDYIERYVTNGVARFVDSNYGYGYDAESAAMLGYVQCFDFDDLQLQIDVHLKKINQPNLQVVRNTTPNRILSHDISTQHSLSKIKLVHFWTDLKKSNGAPKN